MTNESIVMIVVAAFAIFLAKRATVFNLTVSSVINLLALAIAALAFAFVVLENFAVGTVIGAEDWLVTKVTIEKTILVCGATGITLFLADRLLARFTRCRRGGAK